MSMSTCIGSTMNDDDSDDGLPWGKSTLIELGRPLELTGEVVAGPLPHDMGYVYVDVRATDGLLVRGYFTQLFYNALEISPNPTNDHILLGIETIERIKRKPEVWALLQEAHRMRIAAGHPSLLDLEHVGRMISRSPTKALFKVEAERVVFEVWLDAEGRVDEEAEDWDVTTPENAAVAKATAVRWVVDHPEESAALGLDAELFRLFYGTKLTP